MPFQEVLALMAAPFAACMLFVAIHQSFGIHVLRRGVIFVDLALAQMSALGSTIAFAAGHDPTGAAGFAYTLLFSVCGAALLTLARALPKEIHPEAYIGILYVVATAVTVVVIDSSAQGAEHVKEILVGSILAVTPGELPRLALLYGAIGGLLWLINARLSGWLWEFVFYVAFGLVVTSSVAVAGVLLVFCFLIIPSIIGSLFSHYTRTRLAIGWVGGVAASAAGLTASFAWDLPAGAAMVIAFGLALLLACILRALVLGSAATRKRRLVAGLRVALAVVFAITAVSMLWLMIAPRADQPVLDLAEHVSGVGFQRFLQPEERQAYADALNSVRSLQGQAARLTREERQSRWQGEGLSDDAVRNLGSFQQAFSEMAKGQDFVLRQLKARARERQRWHDAPVPLAASLLGLWLLRPRRAP